MMMPQHEHRSRALIGRQQKMVVRFLVSVAVMAILGVCQAHASPTLSAAYQSCAQQAKGAIEQAACLSSESDRQDRRLNQVYQQLQRRLDAAAKARLLAAQRAWLQLRERDDELEAGLYEESQAGNLQQKFNDIERLRSRADQLESYLRLTSP